MRRGLGRKTGRQAVRHRGQAGWMFATNDLHNDFRGGWKRRLTTAWHCHVTGIWCGLMVAGGGMTGLPGGLRGVKGRGRPQQHPQKGEQDLNSLHAAVSLCSPP